jgi:hypothetical protein
VTTFDSLNPPLVKLDKKTLHNRNPSPYEKMVVSPNHSHSNVSLLRRVNVATSKDITLRQVMGFGCLNGYLAGKR